MRNLLLAPDVQNVIKSTIFYNAFKKIRLRQWELQGCPVPPPNVVKQNAVKEFGKRFRISTLVETGTYLGDMVCATRRDFDKIYSIELSEMLYEKARKRFKNHKHISILHGDSGAKLKEVLDEIESAALFWLDAHYSHGITARSDLETPIIQEIMLILDHHIKNHIILIDDAHEFTGSNDYPVLDDFKVHVLSKRPGWHFELRHNMIMIYP